jgi:flagellar assembly factor FliW
VKGESVMKIKTTKFGEIDVKDTNVFKFISPVLGFEKETDFAIVEDKDGSSFKWLQSASTPEVAFLVTSPYYWDIDYSFELPDIAEEKLDIETADDLIVLNVVVVPEGNPKASTVNLLAPIIFNVKSKKAGQFVLSNTKYLVETPLLGGE